MNASPSYSEIDQDALHGDYRESQKKKDKLHLRILHRAANIPMDDDMKVSNRTFNRSGMGWKEMAVLAAAAIGGGYMYTNREGAPPPAAPPAAMSPLDSEYEVLFFDKDGKPIAVPHISQRPAE